MYAILFDCDFFVFLFGFFALQTNIIWFYCHYLQNFETPFCCFPFLSLCQCICFHQLLAKSIGGSILFLILFLISLICATCRLAEIIHPSTLLFFFLFLLLNIVGLINEFASITTFSFIEKQFQFCIKKQVVFQTFCNALGDVYLLISKVYPVKQCYSILVT